MSENLQVQAPYKAKKYTLEQIDHELAYLSILFKHSTGSDRKKMIRVINQWLDKRFNV